MIAFLLAALGALSTPPARAEGDLMILESVEGSSPLSITSRGITRELKAGEAKGAILHPGDRVRTGEGTSVKLRFRDGSSVFVGKGTDYEVKDSQTSVRWSEIHYGKIRALIQPQPGKKELRFAVKSRAAVMGVRGTDFVFSVDGQSGKADIRTLDGEVEVARDVGGLIGGTGTRIARAQYVEASDGTLGEVRGFDRGSYLRELSVADPALFAIAKEELDQGLKWLRFRVGGSYVRQSTGGSAMAFNASWSPHYRLSKRLGFTASLGFTPLKSRSGDVFGSLQGAALLYLWLLGPFAVEAGGGIETWFQHGKPGPLLATYLHWNQPNPGIIECWSVGVTSYSRPGTSSRTYQGIGGLTFRF